MKQIIYKEKYVFRFDANCTNYPKFIQELNNSYKDIKEHYPEVKDEDIRVEFDTDDDYVPMKLIFSTFETDEEYVARMALEKTAKENIRKYQIQQLKKFLKENPDLKEEILNSL